MLKMYFWRDLKFSGYFSKSFYFEKDYTIETLIKRKQLYDRNVIKDKGYFIKLIQQENIKIMCL